MFRRLPLQRGGVVRYVAHGIRFAGRWESDQSADASPARPPRTLSCPPALAVPLGSPLSRISCALQGAERCLFQRRQLRSARRIRPRCDLLCACPVQLVTAASRASPRDLHPRADPCNHACTCAMHVRARATTASVIYAAGPPTTRATACVARSWAPPPRYLVRLQGVGCLGQWCQSPGTRRLDTNCTSVWCCRLVIIFLIFF